MNLILWIGFMGLLVPGVVSSKHHGISKNTFNMNHIRRNKNHDEGKERWVADSKILDQELKQEEPEKDIVSAELTDKHQDLKIEGLDNDHILPDFIDNGGIKGHSEMYDYGEDFDCDDNGNVTVCEEGFYECYGGKCIPQVYVCNEINDCGDLSDEQGCGCPMDQFSCRDGQCIPIQYKCNGYPDCDDKSDEDTGMCKGCDPETQFTCNNGQCIPREKACDKSKDCRDGSDEASTCGINVCDSAEFTCKNGNCISMAQVCNGDNNCGDMSDENACDCEEDEFTCDNHRCIDMEYHCDTADNCRDGSDEIGCHCEAPLYIACRENNRCIAATYQCNGVNDCGQWSDEDDCPCATHEFACTNGHCIQPDNKCDGNNDCGDWSDEMGCGNCNENEITCGNDNCVNKRYECDGKDNCGDATDEEDCGGCIWTEWEGIGMCSEACGVGNQEFTRKQSPWGVKTASDCKQTERKKEECILTGCSAAEADEAIERTQDAMRGVDEEIVYTMEYLFDQLTEEDDKIAKCEVYTKMFEARIHNKLLKVSSGKGISLQNKCTPYQNSGGKDRSLPRRETYDEFGNGYNYANPKRRNRRMKRTPNLGQAMEQSIGKAMGRVKRRVGEIIAARGEDKSRVEDNGDGILLQERKSGLTGLSEDLPLELTSIETKAQPGERGSDAVNYDHLGGNNEFKDSFAM